MKALKDGILSFASGFGAKEIAGFSLIKERMVAKVPERPKISNQERSNRKAKTKAQRAARKAYRANRKHGGA
jgi:hypothetical protein